MSDSSTQEISGCSERIVEICNRFGLKLLVELATTEANRNILISPCNLTLALFMIFNGAGGETKQALKHVLAMRNLTTEEINHGSRWLRDSLLVSTNQFLLTIANNLWAQTQLRFYPPFAEAMRRFYEAEVTLLDFNSPSSLEVINNWVRKQTNGGIKNVLESNDLSAATDCILTSVVYFKGQWTVPFDISETRDDLFHLPNREPRNVPMMQRTGRFQYCETPDFQAVRLPYFGGRLSMYIFLPAEHSSITSLLPEMASLEWKKLIDQFKDKRLFLAVPRFKLTYNAEMSEPLAAIGLGILFRPEADFNPMGLAGHYIEQFKHKTIAEVNEEGTEAAAVTAVIIGRTLQPSLSMIVNRPFFWAIGDDLTGVLVFIGLLGEPEP